MMTDKTIRVKHCGECESSCVMDSYGDYTNNCSRTGKYVYDNIENKTLPDNCPLDDDKYQQEVLEAIKDAQMTRELAVKHIKAVHEKWDKRHENCGCDITVQMATEQRQVIDKLMEQIK